MSRPPDQLSTGVSAVREVLLSGTVPGFVPPPPLTPMPVRAPARVQAAAAVAPRRRAVAYDSVGEELAQVNLALQAAGLHFRVDGQPALQAAKKAAGIGSTKEPVRDFEAFTDRLTQALHLGAFGGVDEDAGAQQAYAGAFKAAVIRELPARSKRLGHAVFGFDDCVALAEAVTEMEVHEMTPAALARTVARKVGSGALAGIFPGESDEATAEEGGQDRLDKMLDLGKDIAEFLRPLGDLKTEVTGSIVLTRGGYGGIPEDLDVNVTTQGSAQERKEQWDAVVDYMNQYDGATMAVKGGFIRVFPLTPGKVQGENGAIWERRYGYVLQVDGQDSRVMPFEVEVKDVGGAVWREHLKEGGDARTTDGSGTSLPQWLMLDTMTRILGHRANMRESVQEPIADLLAGVPADEQAERWLEMVQGEGLDKSHEKRLWEKMHIAGRMARANKAVGKGGLAGWLTKNVRDTAAYLALLATIDDEPAYEAWLQDIA